ncbi:MAG: hypothetical protein WBP59_03190 [Ilumatobacteraceae bacterium]
MTSIALIGGGVVGGRVIARLPVVLPSATIVEHDTRAGAEVPDVDIAILTHGAPHAPTALEFLRRGIHVVSVSDDLDDVRSLLDLEDEALAADATLVVGGGTSPGLTGLLARFLASGLAACDEIHVAVHGTAGPSCARQHHQALSGRAVGYHDGSWIQRPAGSGRELCWFPEPVGAYDCYRARVPTPMLLNRVFPMVQRISGRVSANRRDRFTAWLPMLSPPHREGGVGAVRVEVRGNAEHGARRTVIVGVAELVGTTTAATAGAFAVELAHGRLPTGVVIAGDEQLDTVGMLSTIERLGVRLQEFTGVPSTRRVRANP